MTNFEVRKQLKIERLQKRIATLKAFAEGKDLSMFGEKRSGIPMGQPILVGHHSEARHRRHLERIEKTVRAGFDALKKIEDLEHRLASTPANRAIQCDDPEAQDKLAVKIAKLEKDRAQFKHINILVKKYKDVNLLACEIEKAWPETEDALALATKLLTPDFAGRTGIPGYRLTNLGAEIRRLKKRQLSVGIIQDGFEPFDINNINVHYDNGRIEIEFPGKPDKSIRDKLKALGFLWAPSVTRWVRKHSENTTGEYFRAELRKAITTESEEVC